MPTNFPTQQQMIAIEQSIGLLISGLPKIALQLTVLVLGLAILVFIVWLIRNVLSARRLLKQESILLQLIPPAFADKTPLATKAMFTRLHGWQEIRPLIDKLMLVPTVFTLEVSATRADGIRFGLRVPRAARESFEKDIVAYAPEVRVQPIDDYLSLLGSRHYIGLLGFRQTGRSFAHPLSTQPSLDQLDPVGYLTGAMTNLQKDELVVLQLVLNPTKAPPTRLLRPALGSMKPKTGQAHEASDHKLDRAMLDKLAQPLFKANIRVLSASNDSGRQRKNLNDIRKSLWSLGTSHQSLQARTFLPYGLGGAYALYIFRHRLPDLLGRNTCILSDAEIAGIFHFPHSQSARIQHVIKSLSRTLPVPLAVANLADRGEYDVIIGENVHHGSRTPIGLTSADRERHMYIVGGTGSGKTTLLQHAIIQDIRRGKGVAVVDPHGDLAKTLLSYIPEERIADVIYFDPDDLGFPISLNLLEIPKGVTGDDLLRAKDQITESVVSIFRKIFSDEDSGGHRVEYILRNAVHTALTVEGANIFTIFRLLTDSDFRKAVVDTLDDQDLVHFWKNELGKAGEYQRVKMSAGVTSKIGRFLFSVTARRVMEQPRSSINFDTILDDGKILICNFAKGTLGEDTSELFGITILAKLQLGALKRARLEQPIRRPFYIYVDEFQNFATMSFVQMLSEARKYQVFLTMAEQSTQQQDEQSLVQIMLANVGTIICFRTSSPADEQLLLPLFRPYIEAGEIMNLPSYNYFIRISTIKPQEPFSGETLLLPIADQPDIAQRVMTASRANYASEYSPPIAPANRPSKHPGNHHAKNPKA